MRRFQSPDRTQVTTTGHQHMSQDFTVYRFAMRPWFRRLGMIVLPGFGLWLFIWMFCMSGAIGTNPLHKAHASSNIGQEKPSCAHHNQGTLRGSFLELSCLIAQRRGLRALNHPLDKIVLSKWRALFRRLQKEPYDWRTIGRWQTLYTLGTRMYPLQNKWAHNAEIPVYEVNGHHKSLPFWIKEGLRRNVGPLLHFDTHSDMRGIPSPHRVRRAVEDLKHDRNKRRAWHTIAHTINDCAMPVSGAILAGVHNRVIWGKPSWHPYPEFISRSFFFAEDQLLLQSVTGAAYSSWLSGQASFAPKADPQKPAVSKHFDLFYDPDLEPNKAPLRTGSAWQTVRNSQTATLPVSKKPRFRHMTPFLFSIITTDRPIDPSGRGPGAVQAKKLLKALPRGPFTLDIDLDYFASIDLTQGFRRKPGQRPTQPPHVLQQHRQVLQRRLRNFLHLLQYLQQHQRVPAVVTIADSTFLNFAMDAVAEGQSEYTPIEHAAFLRRHVREILRKVYGDRVIGRGKKPRRPPPAPDASLR